MKFGSNNLEAYPGDSYILSMNRASRAHYAWSSILILAMLFSVIVDLLNLKDLLMRGLDQNLEFINWLMAFAISIIYIVVGSISGNCYRLYKSSNRKIYLYITILCSIACIVFLIIIALVRNNFQITVEHKDSVESLYITLLFTGAMLLGAIASFVFGYFRKNALSEKLAISAISHHAEDKELYNNNKTNYIRDNFNELEYKNKLRNTNNKIKKHLNLSNEAKIKLLMVKNDPAEAKDVIDISNKLNKMFRDEDL